MTDKLEELKKDIPEELLPVWDKFSKAFDFFEKRYGFERAKVIMTKVGISAKNHDLM